MKSNYETLGKHLQLVDKRNTDMVTDRLLGININKYFMPSVANVIGTDLSRYKLLSKGIFACNTMHVGRDERLPVALYTEDIPAIVSPAYHMFKIKDEKRLLPEYLMMWFQRTEFDRICWLKTDGSVRGGISWDDIERLELPVPVIDRQKEIVKAYNTITDRIILKRKINDNLEVMAESIYLHYFSVDNTEASGWVKSDLERTAIIKTGKLNSEDAVVDGKYPFFTCSRETFLTNSYSFEQEAVLLAGNNASAIYPLKIFKGKFDAYQRTYVISSKNNCISNKQLYFTLKHKLQEFEGISSGTTTKFLTMKILNPIQVLVAPKAVANDFIEKMDLIFSMIYENEKQIILLETMNPLLQSSISSS